MEVGVGVGVAEADVLGELEEGVGGEVAGGDELFACGVAVGVDEVFEGEAFEAKFAEALGAGGALGDGNGDLAQGSGV